MKLTAIFQAAIQHSDLLVQLHDALLTQNQRAIRPEWRERFFAAHLTTWPRTAGLWRSANSNVLIVGTDAAQLSHKDFMSQSLEVFLRGALVMAMAAVDKVMHEAISKHFATLAKSGALDKLVDINLSEAYQIAHGARERRGKGGKIRGRPGHKLKAQVLKDIYRDTYLSATKIMEVSTACGHQNIFALFAQTQAHLTAAQAKERWSKLYTRRNSIAHECDLIRQAKPQRARFHAMSSNSMKQDIQFVRMFGDFLSQRFA